MYQLNNKLNYSNPNWSKSKLVENQNRSKLVEAKLAKSEISQISRQNDIVAISYICM